LTEALLEIGDSYWSIPVSEYLKKCSVDLDPQKYQANGLTSKDADNRLLKYGKNLLSSIVAKTSLANESAY
jgi:hypothetical protein